MKTMTVNPSYNPTTQLTYSGYTGQHKLVVALDDSTYREYTLDFDTGTAKPEKRYDYKPATTEFKSEQPAIFQHELGDMTRMKEYSEGLDSKRYRRFLLGGDAGRHF